MRRQRQQRRSERGQSLVELAVIAPILVLILFGLVELGFGLNSYMTVVASARDGARLGVAPGVSDESIRELVEKETERLSGSIPSSCSAGAPGVCIARATTAGASSVEVSVCYDHDPVIGIPGVLSGPLRMCSSTVMRTMQ